MKYYMHTLDGLPAAYMPEEKQICFLARYGNRKSAEYMTESTELLPCPFCGGKADPTGWMADSGGNFTFI